MKPDLRPYPDYKPSGIPWLGEVPEHWILERLKSSMNNIVVQTTERQSTDLYIAMEHVESWSGRLTNAGLNTPFDSQVKRFRSGDVLFGKLRPYLAKVTRPRSEGVCVGEFLVLRPRHSQVTAPYMEQLLRSKPIIDTVNSSTFGARMPRADWKFMGGMAIVRPPLPEQAAITHFLDYTDRRIQRYIQAKQKLITLLEEQRQAIIHQAVTGQIDVRTGQPYPAYQDSGVEWLGEVPEHWGVWKVGHFSKVGNGSTPSRSNAAYWSNGTHPWLNSSSVNQGTITGADQFVTDLALRECHLPQVPQGSVLVGITGQGKTRGMAALLAIETTINQHMAYITPSASRVSSHYLQMYLTAAYSELRALSDDSGSTKGALTCEDIKRFKIALPPLPEQTAIVNFLDHTTTSIDRAIFQTQRQIDLLNEYRTRLISDVVTGKLDVREAAARLPKVDPLETEDDSADTLEPATELEDELEAIAEGASA